jgi:TM2 domain-containing membrane protein YozV
MLLSLLLLFPIAVSIITFIIESILYICGGSDDFDYTVDFLTNILEQYQDVWRPIE